MVVEKGRYVGIDLGKRTWEMAIITRSGKFKTNEQGDAEPEEKTTRYSGRTTAEGRLQLYGKLEAGDKVALEAGNLAFIMAKELGKVVGCSVRALNPHRLAIIYATDKKTDKEDALKLAQLVADRPDSRLPTVAIPSDEEMERRKVVSSYRQENFLYYDNLPNLGITKYILLYYKELVNTSRSIFAYILIQLYTVCYRITPTYLLTFTTHSITVPCQKTKNTAFFAPTAAFKTPPNVAYNGPWRGRSPQPPIILPLSAF
jgi:hypothetical protein